MPTLTRAQFTAEHDGLLRLSAELTALLGAPARIAEVSAVRWRMTRMLTMHLAREDRLLYPMLRGGPDARVRAIADRFAAEMGGLADAWRSYVADWTIERIEQDWPGFAEATRALLAALRRRVVAEEAQLYAHLGSETVAFGQRARPGSPS